MHQVALEVPSSPRKRTSLSTEKLWRLWFELESTGIVVPPTFCDRQTGLSWFYFSFCFCQGGSYRPTFPLLFLCLCFCLFSYPNQQNPIGWVDTGSLNLQTTGLIEIVLKQWIGIMCTVWNIQPPSGPWVKHFHSEGLDHRSSPPVIFSEEIDIFSFLPQVASIEKDQQSFLMIRGRFVM